MPRPLVLLVALATTLLAGVASAACLPAPDGLIAWYPGERHADDAAGFHHGVLQDGTLYVDAFNGEGFRFDGIDDAVFTRTLGPEQRAVDDAFSYSVWVKPSGTQAVCPEATSGACGGLRWAIFPAHGDNTGGGTQGGVAAGIGLAVGSNGICVGQHAAFLLSCLASVATPISDWTHVVVVVEDKRPRLYIDGALARTGLRSEREVVFASWEVFGSGLSLGSYQGDLDDLAIFGRALSDTEIGELFLAGGDGMCAVPCTTRSDDAFEGATITSHSALRSTHADGLFGAVDGSPEVDTVVFADGLADGSVHSVEWETPTPVILGALGLHALHDAPGGAQRAFRHVRVQARMDGGSAFQTLYERDVVVPYSPTGPEMHHCARVRPATFQEFRVEFTQDGPAGFSGPRVLELDGVAIPQPVFRDGFETP